MQTRMHDSAQQRHVLRRFDMPAEVADSVDSHTWHNLSTSSFRMVARCPTLLRDVAATSALYSNLSTGSLSAS